MKKLVLILLSILLLTSTVVNAAPMYGEELSNIPNRVYAQTFKDVDRSHWAFNYISELVEKGIISGYPDGKFRPDNSITRSEFAKIMINASGIKATAVEYTSFADVTINDWYAPYVEAAKPFLNGYIIANKNMYLPESKALREDIAVALVKLKGYDVSVADISMLYTMFSDAESISTSAQRYIAVAIERGLVSGYSDETFRGQQTITRAEACALLWRASQFGNDNKVTEILSETVEPNVFIEKEEIVKEEIPNSSKKETVIEAVYKPYNINTIVEDIGDVYNITIDKNNIVYYVTEDAVIGTNGYELSFSHEGFSCCPEKENNKRHICKIGNRAIAYNKSSDKLFLIANVDDYTYLFDVTNEEPIVNLELDYSCYSNKLQILTNGYILNGCTLFNSKGKCVLELNGDSIYYNNKFYWFDMDVFDVDTELRCEDINGDIIKVDSKADFSYYQTQAFESFNNSLYVLTNDGFYEYDTDGYEDKIISLKDDVEILDFKSINIKVDSFVLDNKNNIIFYDKDSDSIRKISKN